MSIKYYVDCGLMVIWISRNRKVFDNVDIQFSGLQSKGDPKGCFWGFSKASWT